MITTVAELAKIKHPYYCSSSNYYSNDAAAFFTTMTDFLNEHEDDDIDMNLCFRFDVREREDDNGAPLGIYDAEVFILHQRNGIFRPCYIERFTDSEVQRFIEYAEKHFETLLAMWKPLS